MDLIKLILIGIVIIIFLVSAFVLFRKRRDFAVLTIGVIAIYLVLEIPLELNWESRIVSWFIALVLFFVDQWFFGKRASKKSEGGK